MDTRNKQKKEDDPKLIALFEILKTGYWYEKKAQEILNVFEISHEQYNVLRILEHNHPRQFSLKEVQARLLNKTPNTTRLVEKLRIKGYVDSSMHEDNRRMLKITLTSQGQKFIQKVKIPLNKLVNSVKSRLNQKEAKLLSKMLRQVRKSG